MVVVYNKYIFIQDGFKERTLRKTTQMEWFTYNLASPQVMPINVEITELTTDDSYFPSWSNN